jgi:hypothetical protein
MKDPDPDDPVCSQALDLPVRHTTFLLNYPPFVVAESGKPTNQLTSKCQSDRGNEKKWLGDAGYKISQTEH